MATKTTKKTIRKKATSASTPYRPYHRHGEFIFLLVIATLAIAFFMVPMNFWLKLAGAFILLILLPTNVLREYWPKLQLHELGWRRPTHPRTPWLYSAVVIALAFLPLVLFFTVTNPAGLTAVSPRGAWLEWLIAEVLVAGLWLMQTAFFHGLVLFRLTHLTRPWIAMLIVGLLMGISQMFGPGSLQIFLLPTAVAMIWLAWQTRSFVPAAVATIGISFLFDLFVRLTVA